MCSDAAGMYTHSYDLDYYGSEKHKFDKKAISYAFRVGRYSVDYWKMIRAYEAKWEREGRGHLIEKARKLTGQCTT